MCNNLPQLYQLSIVVTKKGPAFLLGRRAFPQGLLEHHLRRCLQIN